MSDVNATAEPPEWTPDLMRQLVAVDQGFYAYTDGVQLTVSDTRNVLKKRIGDLPGPAGRPANITARNMVVDLIARAIPAELRNPRVLASIDLRPYFYQIATQAGRFAYRKNTSIPDEMFPHEVADWMLQQANVEAQNFASDQMIGPDVTEQERQAALEDALRFQPSLASQNQAARFVTSQQEAAGTANVVWEGQTMSMFEEQTREPTFDVTGLRQLVGSGLMGLEEITNREAMFNEEQGTPGEMRQFIQVGEGQMPIGQRMFPTAVAPGAPQKLSVVGAITFLDGLTDAEFLNFQEQMSRAGYDLRAGKQMQRGYRDDDATQAAWIELLKDAYAQNKPLERVLVDGAQQQLRYQQTQWQEVQQSQSLAAMVNQVARKIIERDLNAQEFGAVYKAFAALQQQRMGEPVLGLDASYDPTTGLSEADIEQTVFNVTAEERQFSPERVLGMQNNYTKYWGLPGLPEGVQARMQELAILPPPPANRALEVMERRRQMEEAGEL